MTASCFKKVLFNEITMFTDSFIESDVATGLMYNRA